jgi:hypothetical protein
LPQVTCKPKGERNMTYLIGFVKNSGDPLN